MRRILLVRHGETVQNREKISQGSDPTLGRLTDKGMRQAYLLGQALAGRGFDMVYCSPLERAVLTLGQVLAPRGGERTLPLHFADELKEINLGEIHGKSHAEWREARGDEDPMTYRAPGGESWLDVQRRTGEFFLNHILPSPHREILVISHGGVNRGILSTVLAISMERAWQGPGAGTPQDNTCVNTLAYNGSGELLEVVVNDTSHLHPEFPEAGRGQRWITAQRTWEMLDGPE